MPQENDIKIPILHEVEEHRDMKFPGDYQWLTIGGKKNAGIIMVCLCGAFIGTEDKWTVHSVSPIHLEPSIHHIGPGCHFFIRDGKIVLA